MKLKFLAIAFLSCLTMAAKTDNKDIIKFEAIQDDPEIIWGEGTGMTSASADEAALLNLASKITVTITGESSQTDISKSGNGAATESSEFKSMVKSYTGATLANAQYLSLGETKTGEYRVVRYMRKSDVDKIYDRRRERVFDYVRSAIRAEENGKVDDALRYFNRAYVLLHSLRHPNEIKMDVDGTDRLLVNWIPEQMKEICENVKISVASREGSEALLYLEYKGRPATSLDYRYFDGRNWSGIYTAKDGRGEIDYLPNTDKLEVRLEYEYRDEVQADKELMPLLDNFQGLPLRCAFMTVGNGAPSKLKDDKGARKAFEAANAAAKKEGVASLGQKDAKVLAATVTKIVEAVKSKNYESVRNDFTPEGFGMFERLMKYGKAKIVGNPQFSFYPMPGRTVCRSIPMSFDFPKAGRKFLEDVTFTFNPEGKVESLAFSLGSVARNAIFSQGGTAWSDTTKMVICTFLENYKTAFALERHDYIKSIFDDNAYIIVGHVVKRLVGGKNGDGYSMATKEDVSYARKSKKEYLDQLNRCFKANEFINIRFADNDVLRAGYGGDTFGIQIKQEYVSSTYADQGYLFLLVDLNEPDQPIIRVRTWQPERNPNITPNLPKDSRDYGIFSVGSFQ